MIHKSPHKGEADDLPPDGENPSDEGVEFIDVLLVLVRHKHLIIRTVVVVTICALAYALASPNEYTTSTQVVRESQNQAPNFGGGLSALQGLGVNLGMPSTGLSPNAFPSVVSSQEVRLAVARDTFQVPDADSSVTFIEYANRPPGPLQLVLDYTLFLPWTLKEDLLEEEQTTDHRSAEIGEQSVSRWTEQEGSAIRLLSDLIFTEVDEQTGLMTISVTAEDPELAAGIAESVLRHLRSRIRELRTEQVRERLRFVEERFADAKSELETAEERLAQFLERNQRINAPKLEFQRDQLRRQVGFKEQLYSELQKQLTQTRLDLQRQQPVVTVVEGPVVPRRPSGPNRTLILVLGAMVGGVFGITLSLVVAYFENQNKDGDKREKIEEIRENLLPHNLLEQLQDRFTA